MRMQTFIKNIPHGTRDRASFTFSEFVHRQSLDQDRSVSLFQYSDLVKASTSIRTSAKPRLMINVIMYTYGVELVNINVYANYCNVSNFAYVRTTHLSGRLMWTMTHCKTTATKRNVCRLLDYQVIWPSNVDTKY